MKLIFLIMFLLTFFSIEGSNSIGEGSGGGGPRDQKDGTREET